MKRLLTPSPAMVVAVIALIVALSGSALAAGLIRGSQIADRTIGGEKLRNGAVAAAQVKRNSLTGAQVRDGQLTGADVRNGSIGAADLAPRLRAGRGPAGPRGPEGPRGQQGPAGPSAALAGGTAAGGEVATAVDPAPIGKIDLPAGRHAVIAKLTISSVGNSVPYAAVCTLTAGQDADRATVSGLAPTQNLASTPVTLTIVHASPAADAAVVACGDSGTQASTWKDLRITAIEVGSIAAVSIAP